MRKRRTVAVTFQVVLSVGFCAGATGCAILNGLLDPTAVGRYNLLDSHEGSIRRVLTPRETPPGVANATEPTPEDLVPVYQDYRIGPSDVIAVMVQNFSEQGDLQSVLEVSHTGMIRLPRLGSMKAAGLNEQELEQELKARLKEAEILPDPIVQVLVQNKRQQYFTIIGAVGAAGPYPLADPEFRLLDALGLARDIDASVKRLYVIRRENGKRLPQMPPVEPAGDSSKTEGLVIPPPGEEGDNPKPGSLFAGMGMGRQDVPTETQRREPTEEEQLEELLAPKSNKKNQGAAATQGVRKPSDEGLTPLIFDPQTGRAVELKPEKKPEELAKPQERTTAAPPKQPGFDWNAVPETEGANRVIEIDVPALRQGDPRQNVVIRNRDVIQVPQDTGVFYLMGEINRPGVYAFGGREITVKQAVSVGGNFTPLAWPSRCEIIRREPGTDKQATIPVNLDSIFAGLEEDVLLRDDDILNVGTNVISPFLFVIRNSFRFTYGFGFVYDRNFADKDAYFSRQNPQALAEQRRAQRGLPF